MFLPVFLEVSTNPSYSHSTPSQFTVSFFPQLLLSRKQANGISPCIGRPSKPDSEKKPKKAPSGLGGGRPKGSGAPKAKPAKAPKVVKAAAEDDASTPAKKRGRPSAADETSTPASTAGKKRGRPAATKAEDAPSAKKAKKA